jgi:hypothetical protein
MLNRLADRQRDIEDVRNPMVGIEHAPALVDWLRQQPESKSSMDRRMPRWEASPGCIRFRWLASRRC